MKFKTHSTSTHHDIGDLLYNVCCTGPLPHLLGRINNSRFDKITNMPLPSLFCQDQLDKGHVQREDKALEVILEQQGREEIQPVGRLLKLIIIVWFMFIRYSIYLFLFFPI